MIKINKTKEKTTKTKGNTKKKFNPDYAYEYVTQKLIDYIEQHNVLPWTKPWMVAKPEVSPQNFVTGTIYKGVNVFLTLMSGYSSPYWISLNQANELGGKVKKGEHGLRLVVYKPNNERKRKIDEDPNLTEEEKEEKKKKVFGFYKLTKPMFNAKQIEGVEFPEQKPVDPREFNPIGEAEKVYVNMPNKPKLTHGGGRAFYRPSSDTVTLPPQKTFRSAEDYYSTMFHELAHSTGHEKRLGRLGEQYQVTFGSKDYSKEELVAELSSSFIMNELGLENENTEQNTAAYLKGWCKALKAEPKMLMKAMNKAIPATNYIFNREAQ